MISKWGAFWGVLFAGFAFYFLRYNARRFYTKNPNWYYKYNILGLLLMSLIKKKIQEHPCDYM
jgi:hypothetical protein